jgi:hypothetical protein
VSTPLAPPLPQALPCVVGASRCIREAAEQVELIAQTEATCLLLGETGTGKELFARAIHYLSPPARCRPLCAGALAEPKAWRRQCEENLTPITYTANSDHEQFVESLLKDLIGESGAGRASRKGMAYYKVEADYSSVPRKISDDDDKGVLEEEGYLASRLKTTWYQLVPNPNDPAKPVQTGPQHNFFVKNVPPYPKV